MHKYHIIHIYDEGKWSDTEKLTYQANFMIYENGDHLLDEFQGSTWPNPFNPKKPSLILDQAYGCVDVGKYWWEYGDHAHNNKPGINICRNGPLVALTDNPYHNGLPYVDHVDIHSGDNTYWRGSAACLTIRPDLWNDFLKIVKGKYGILLLERKYNFVG